MAKSTDRVSGFGLKRLLEKAEIVIKTESSIDALDVARGVIRLIRHIVWLEGRSIEDLPRLRGDTTQFEKPQQPKMLATYSPYRKGEKRHNAKAGKKRVEYGNNPE